MTTITEVSKALLKIANEHKSELAHRWQHNEIIKKKLAQSYDAWITDIWDHKTFVTLEEHIIFLIDHYFHFSEEIFQ